MSQLLWYFGPRLILPTDISLIPFLKKDFYKIISHICSPDADTTSIKSTLPASYTS